MEYFIVNFMGHGAESVLGDNIAGGSNYLELSDVPNMTNSKWPILMALNCLTGYYAKEDYEDKGLGEVLLLKEGAGTIGVISANTFLSPISQETFANYFYDELNRVSADGIYDTRLGDIFKNTHKRMHLAGLSNSETDSFLLLGDPSLKLPKTVFSNSNNIKSTVHFGSGTGGGCSAGAAGGASPGNQDGLLEIFTLFMIYLFFRKYVIKLL